MFYNFQEGLIVPINPPAIPGLGVTAGFQMWIEQKGAGNFVQLADVVERIIAKARTRPELAGVNTTIRATTPQIYLDVDREKAETLGVPMQRCLRHPADPVRIAVREPVHQVQPALPGYCAGRGRLPHQARGHRPGLRALARRQDDSLEGLGDPEKRAPGPDLVSRFNSFPAARVLGAAAPGYSSGDARGEPSRNWRRRRYRRLLPRLERRGLRAEEGGASSFWRSSSESSWSS